MVWRRACLITSSYDPAIETCEHGLMAILIATVDWPGESGRAVRAGSRGCDTTRLHIPVGPGGAAHRLANNDPVQQLERQVGGRVGIKRGATHGGVVRLQRPHQCPLQPARHRVQQEPCARGTKIASKT